MSEENTQIKNISEKDISKDSKNKKNEITSQIPPPLSIAEEDEIDIMEIIEILLSYKNILIGVSVSAVILGIVLFVIFPKEYQAHSQIKIIKQVLDKFTDDVLQYHVIKLTEHEFVAKFEKILAEKQHISSQDIEKLNLKVEAQIDKRQKALINLSAIAADPEIAISYAKIIISSYPEILYHYLKNKDQIAINSLEARSKFIFTKLTDTEKKLNKFNKEKLLKFEIENTLYTKETMLRLLTQYRKIENILKFIEAALPSLKTGNTNEICDIFQRVCANYTQLSLVATKSDTLSLKVWPILREFKDKSVKIEQLKTRLSRMKYNKKISEKQRNRIAQKLNDAEEEMKIFKKLLITQIEARKEVLKIEERKLKMQIKECQRYQNQTAKEFLKYKELKRLFNSFNQEYQSVNFNLKSLKNKPDVKYYIEVITKPKIQKTNFIKRLLILLFTPIVIFFITAFCLIFYSKFKEYNQHKQAVG